MPEPTKLHIPEPYAGKVRARILRDTKEVNGCWEWQKSLTVHGGYAQMMLSLEPKKPQLFTGHRASWLVFRGDLAPGLHLDHLCRNHECINPDHLEPVTPLENLMRGEVAREGIKISTPVHYCRHGHSMTGKNLYEYKQAGLPRIICRACKNERNRLARVRNIGAQSGTDLAA